MLVRFAAAAVLSITLPPAFAGTPLPVGSWQTDNGRAYAEVHFRPDHTFTLFTRVSLRNPELAVAEMAEQFGAWHIAGGRVVLDSTARSSKERSHTALRFSLRGDSLRMQCVYDTSRTDTYHRLHLPVCAELRSTAQGQVETLIGRWRGHYRTHETEFVFQPNRRVDFYSWDLGSRRKFYEATWRLRKDILSMKGRGGDGHITWHILHVSRRCMVVSDGSEMSYTLQRTG